MSDATTFTRCLLDAFPQATDSDVRLGWELCRSYREEVWRKAIDAYRLALGEKVFRPDLKRLAAICRAKEAEADQRIDRPQVDATRAYLAGFNRVAKQVAAEQQRVDQIIAGLSPEDRERAKQEALKRMPNEMFRKQNEFADPLDPNRKLLRALMVQWLEQGGEVAA